MRNGRVCRNSTTNSMKDTVHPAPLRAMLSRRAKAWYYAELLKEERKRQKLTQQQLADKIGKKREYISTIERGNSDMQMSTFLQIASALGLRFSLVVG